MAEPKIDYDKVTNENKLYTYKIIEFFNMETDSDLNLPDCDAIVDKIAKKAKSIERDYATYSMDNFTEELDKALVDEFNDIFERALDKNPKVNDEQFKHIHTSFIKAINRITIAYKQDHGMTIKDSITNTVGLVSADKLEEYYERATNKRANNKDIYKDSVKDVFFLSRRMCNDLDNAIHNSKFEERLDKASVIYKEVEEKYNKRNWFSKWFTIGGYRERNALKKAKEDICQLAHNVNEGNFDRVMTDHSLKKVPVLEELVEGNLPENYKVIDDDKTINIFDAKNNEYTYTLARTGKMDKVDERLAIDATRMPYEESELDSSLVEVNELDEKEEIKLNNNVPEEQIDPLEKIK